MQSLQKSRVASFPAEMLTEIFAELQFKGRLYTSHTCRHWRASSLSSRAKLWTCIASYCRVPGALLAQLERAQPLPVSVYVSFHGRTPGIVRETARAIDQHLSHTRLLVVHGSGSYADLSRADFVKIFKSFRSPAPILEEFELLMYGAASEWDADEPSEDTMSSESSDGVVGDERQQLLSGELQINNGDAHADASPGPVLPATRASSIDDGFETEATLDFIIPPDLFAGAAPRLWRVNIHGDREISQQRCAAFFSVRQFTWEPSGYVDERDIEAIERSLPLLERFNIDYVPLDPHGGGEGHDQLSSLQLQQLYVAAETRVKNASPLWLLKHLQFQRVPDVQCLFDSDEYIDDWFPEFFVDGANTDYSLRMVRWSASEAAWRIEDLGARPGRRVLELERLSLDELPDPVLWENLVRLELYEYFVADFVDLLEPLPRVTQLQLIYSVPDSADMECHGMTQLEDSLSVLSYPYDILAPIPCPQLRTFELLPEREPGSYSPPVLLAPEDIYDFMRLCLSYRAPKLDEVIVWDAEILTLSLDHLWLLIDSVANLRVADSGGVHHRIVHCRGFAVSKADGWDPESRDRK